MPRTKKPDPEPIRRRVFLWVPRWHEWEGPAPRAVQGIPVDGDIKQVWTVMPQTPGPQSPDKPPCADPMTWPLEHGRTVFCEDIVHDWNQRGGKLNYYSRVSAGDGWVLLEFHDPPFPDRK